MRFVALDGWRGLCALAVALFHLRANSHLYDVGVIRNSYLFVDFFFVLSGFVVTSAYLGRLGTASGGVVFMIRRFGRLYPLHVAVLALFVIVETAKLAAASHGIGMQSPPFVGETSVQALFTNLLMAHSLGLHDSTTWNFTSWSISVEFYCYALFAIAVLATARVRTRTRLAVFAVTAAVGAAATVAWSTTGMDTTYDFGFFRCVYGFFLGAIAERLFEVVLSARLAGLSRPAATLLELALVALVVVFVTKAEHRAVSFLAPIVFLPAVIVFAGQRGLLSGLLSSRPMRALGDWSYSIYMIHAFLVIDVVGRLVALARRLLPVDLGPAPAPNADLLFDFGSPIWGDILAIAYIALVIALAGLTSRYIEAPGRSLFNRLAGGRVAAEHDQGVGAPTAS
ncbi:MAG: acyltransferase [Ancalomicrobiaceae bacterium]|nr:acyltransferase [Ancalomicrobiaceae bacterium]